MNRDERIKVATAALVKELISVELHPVHYDPYPATIQEVADEIVRSVQELDQSGSARGLAMRVLESLVPGRWDMPPEPGPEVTCVRDRGRKLWNRPGPGMGNNWVRSDRSIGVRWPELVSGYGPLVDVTGSVAEELEPYPMRWKMDGALTPELARWAIAEPGLEVTHVHDAEGWVWARTGNPQSDPWVTRKGGHWVSRTWVALLVNNGPLSDATERMREDKP